MVSYLCFAAGCRADMKHGNKGHGGIEGRVEHNVWARLLPGFGGCQACGSSNTCMIMQVVHTVAQRLAASSIEGYFSLRGDHVTTN